MKKQTPTQLYKKHLEFIPTQIGRGAKSVSFGAFCQRLRDGRTPKKAVETPRNEKRVSKKSEVTKKDLERTQKEVSKAGVKMETPAETPKEPTKEKMFEVNLHTENKILVPRDLSRVDKVWGWIGVFVLSHFVASGLVTLYEAILTIFK